MSKARPCEKRLDRGPLPVAQVCRVGAAITEALAKAHRQGILHRDLKPANIMLTTSGAKLLDFGLARPSGAGAMKATATQTLSSGDGVIAKPLTAEGAIVGTLQYMAPEQLEGKETDARTDIFALGAVLYEMAAGHKAFTAKSQASMVAAVLEHEPEPLSRVQPLTPPALERAVQRCLAKDPDERWQSAADLASELRWISSTGASGIIPAVDFPSRRALHWLPWTLAVIAVIAVALLTFHLMAGSTPPMRQQFAIVVPGEVSHLALSPDGQYLAFVSPDDVSGTNLVFVQDVGGSASRPLAGTEGASYPFWSPDDKYVGFFANGKLKKVPVAGGPPEALADAGAGRGGTWGRRDIILYTPESAGGIWRINADGSGNTRASDRMEPGEVSHRWPVFLPDGEHYLYWRGSFSERPDAKRGIYLGSLDNGSVHLVTTARSSMGYGDGMLFYVDERGSLVFAPLDISKAKLTRERRFVSSTVGFSPSTYWGAFTVAENGTVVLNSSLGAALSQLTWYDRNGKELERVGDAAIQANPSISPDGTRVAMDANDAKARNIDVWIENLKSGTMTRFTFDPAEENTPVWSRDGNRIAYRMGNPEGGALQVKKATGLEPERTIQHAGGGGEFLPNSWSVDGSQILCTYISTQGEPKLVLVSNRDGKPTPFAAGDRGASNGQISPNGKWVAFASNESGDWEIYVTTFPGAAGKWQVSRGGGTEPRWSANGKEIYYVGSKGVLTAVPIEEDGAFATGVPHPLFRIHSRAPISSTDLFTYDVSPDGQRFLVNRYVKPDLIPPLTIVLHATSR